MLGDVVVSWDAARRRAAAAAAGPGGADPEVEEEVEEEGDEEAELWRLMTEEPVTGGPEQTVRPLLVHGLVSVVGAPPPSAASAAAAARRRLLPRALVCAASRPSPPVALGAG